MNLSLCLIGVVNRRSNERNTCRFTCRFVSLWTQQFCVRNSRPPHLIGHCGSWPYDYAWWEFVHIFLGHNIFSKNATKMGRVIIIFNVPRDSFWLQRTKRIFEVTVNVNKFIHASKRASHKCMYGNTKKTLHTFIKSFYMFGKWWFVKPQLTINELFIKKQLIA